MGEKAAMMGVSLTGEKGVTDVNWAWSQFSPRPLCLLEDQTAALPFVLVVPVARARGKRAAQSARRDVRRYGTLLARVCAALSLYCRLIFCAWPGRIFPAYRAAHRSPPSAIYTLRPVSLSTITKLMLSNLIKSTSVDLNVV